LYCLHAETVPGRRWTVPSTCGMLIGRKGIHGLTRH
jgi:hypothetical protein